MKISIIIPIYNVEKYVEKCLLSCVNQNISSKDYEIIVVNDGSPDNSLAIVERVAENNSNIRIISQANQGLSVARNTGVRHAYGEYIWFIDSDDYIEENCLARIVSYLKDDLDILQLQYRLVYEDDTLPLDIEFYNIEGVKSGLEITEQGGLPAPAQFSIYRSKFLTDYNLEFVEGIYHEDSEFKPRVTFLAKKITSDSSISYNYLQRLSGSITSHFKIKNGLDIINVNNSLLDFADKQNMPKKYRKYLYEKIAMNMNTLLYGLQSLNKDEKNQLIYQLRMNKHLFDCMVNSNRFKYKIEGIFFKLNIQLGLFLHRYIR